MLVRQIENPIANAQQKKKSKKQYQKYYNRRKCTAQKKNLRFCSPASKLNESTQCSNLEEDYNSYSSDLSQLQVGIKRVHPNDNQVEAKLLLSIKRGCSIPLFSQQLSIPEIQQRADQERERFCKGVLEQLSETKFRIPLYEIKPKIEFETKQQTILVSENDIEQDSQLQESPVLTHTDLSVNNLENDCVNLQQKPIELISQEDGSEEDQSQSEMGLGKIQIEDPPRLPSISSLLQNLASQN